MPLVITNCDSCLTKAEHVNNIILSENQITLAVSKILNFVISIFISTNNLERNEMKGNEKER